MSNEDYTKQNHANEGKYEDKTKIAFLPNFMPIFLYFNYWYVKINQLKLSTIKTYRAAHD